VAVASETHSVERGPASLGARPDDGDLAERFARAEAGAFEEVVERYQAMVARLAYRLLGWSGEAEDVVQDVFLAALKNASGFRRGAMLSTWLTTITLNKCRSHRRGVLARLRMLAGLGRGPKQETGAAADVGLAEKEEFSRVQEAMRQLSARDREVVVLHYLEGNSVEEMAGLLGVTRGAVEVRLHRARGRLRKLLGAEEVGR
jgi:RNA polymerase sigma-70 factor (ECF subfamily)